MKHTTHPAFFTSFENREMFGWPTQHEPRKPKKWKRQGNRIVDISKA
jgi:hypothetical protein